jgi:hypothetical protein
MIRNLLCWVILAFVVVSCDKSYVTPDPVARGLNFYPVEVGDYRIYNVKDIKYQHNEPTELNFQMREWVVDSFMDQTNTLTYKIIRSIRPNAESEWEDDSVMTVTKNHTMVTLTKDNTKYVKMVFPVVEGKKWEADAYNTRYDYNGDREKYIYSKVDQLSVINNTEFDKTVLITVLPALASETTDYDDRQEIYARNVGRIYRLFHKESYAPCNLDVENGCPDGAGFILDGHKREEVLIEHGKL